MRLVAAIATGLRTVRLAFDEPATLSIDSRFTIAPLSTPAAPLTVVAALTGEAVVDLELNWEATPDARYEVRLSGVRDRAGQVVLAPFDTATFVGFRPQRPANRRFDLLSFLPEYNRQNDHTGDLRRFIACLQEVADLILAEIDRFPDIFDFERAPPAFLELILQDLANPFAFELNTLQQRRLASVLVEMYAQKGTAPGIRNAVRFFMGLEVELVPFAATSMVLGESLLGVDWLLGPSTRFARYAFEVRVPRFLSPSERRQIRVIVDYLKPVHTHFVALREPEPPQAPHHWHLGTSDLGVETVLD